MIQKSTRLLPIGILLSITIFIIQFDWTLGGKGDITGEYRVFRNFYDPKYHDDGRQTETIQSRSSTPLQTPTSNKSKSKNKRYKLIAVEIPDESDSKLSKRTTNKQFKEITEYDNLAVSSNEVQHIEHVSPQQVVQLAPAQQQIVQLAPAQQVLHLAPIQQVVQLAPEQSQTIHAQPVQLVQNAPLVPIVQTQAQPLQVLKVVPAAAAQNSNSQYEHPKLLDPKLISGAVKEFVTNTGHNAKTLLRQGKASDVAWAYFNGHHDIQYRPYYVKPLEEAENNPHLGHRFKAFYMKPKKPGPVSLFFEMKNQIGYW